MIRVLAVAACRHLLMATGRRRATTNGNSLAEGEHRKCARRSLRRAWVKAPAQKGRRTILRSMHMGRQPPYAARRVSVREAFTTVGLQLPATHFKNQTRSRAGGPCMRSVQEQSFTVCASHGLTWCDAGGATGRVMTARESAVLMGFQTTWRLPQGSRAAQRAVGNALCVAQSKAIVQVAISILSGEPVPVLPLPTSQTEPLAKPQEMHSRTIVNRATKDKDHRKLCKRVRALEAVVMDLQRHCLARMAGMARSDQSLNDHSGSE